MQKACNSLSCTLLLIVYYVFTFWHYFTSSKTTLTDYQCVSTGCCTHVAKTEITIDNQHVATKRKHIKYHILATFS